MIYRITHTTKKINTSVKLPASKSLSNRALIIRELSKQLFEIENLSQAADTLLLNKLLKSSNVVVDCEDAGTTLRFITAYYALQGEEKIITGSDRMKLRPVGELVHALRLLGANITFIEKEGFPPFKIGKGKLSGGKISIDSSISSQFISALLMIAPYLKGGLDLTLTGDLISLPYIEMTLSMMKYFGVEAIKSGNSISIEPQVYKTKRYYCEADWTAASYWFEIAALANEAEINFDNLEKNSWQGDAIIIKMMEQFGVNSKFNGKQFQLKKTKLTRPDFFTFNFKDCPDLAQTMAATCAGLNVPADLKGLQSLRIKETNRAEAMQRELYNLAVQTDFCDYSKLKIYNHRPINYLNRPLKTHNDHRMAMSLAPLALKLPFLEIENPDVVNKSYPGFWKDMIAAGFEIEEM